MKPRLLELFSGASGAGAGYAHAGLDVVSVDIKAQPNCPHKFIQADALEVLADKAFVAGFNAIHASPPCQHYSSVSGKARRRGKTYPDLVAPTRALLHAAGLPYVIENVPGAPLQSPIRLCGSSFGLDLRRHRLFEISGFDIGMVTPCAHHWQTPRFRSLNASQKTLASVVGVHGNINYAGEFELRQKAMGIDWMTNAELTQAIPPAYTEFIGQALVAAIEAAAS